MKSSKEVEQEFMQDFQDLLRRWRASIDLQEEEMGNVLQRGLDEMVITIPADYTVDGKCLAEWTQINLGRYQDYEL